MHKAYKRSKSQKKYYDPLSNVAIPRSKIKELVPTPGLQIIECYEGGLKWF